MSYPRVRYGLWTDAWNDYGARARELAQAQAITRVCDLGGGADPALPLDFLRENDVEYSIVDVSAEELAKAPAGYAKVLADATAPQVALGPYDLVLSQFLGEHVPTPARLHANVLSWLRPGGRALHFFPTLYAPPFVFNRVMPERLSELLLLRIQPQRHSEGRHGKFPALYRWCRGPTRRQLRRFERIGYEIEEYVGYFGHPYYDRLPGARRIETRIASALSRCPVPALTAYAIVVLQKPACGPTVGSPCSKASEMIASSLRLPGLSNVPA